MRFSSDIVQEEVGLNGCWTAGIPVLGCFTLGRPDKTAPVEVEQ